VRLVFDGASMVISLKTGQINARAGLVNSETSLQQARTSGARRLLAARIACRGVRRASGE